MARPLKPFVRSGGYYPSAKYTPLVYPGGYTTLNAKNGKPEPLNTFVGKIVQFLAKRSLPMVKLEANFTPIQNLNGYDAPYPPGGGKNKFPITLTTQTKNGTTFTVADDGSITVSGTPSERAVVTLSSAVFSGLGNMTGSTTGAVTGVRVYCRRNEGGTNTYPSITSSYSMSTDTATFDQFILEVTTSFSGTATVIKVQVESGTTATAWSPYSNICPISGHTGCDVVRTGKNLLNTSFNTTTNGGITFSKNDDGTVHLEGAISSTNNYCTVVQRFPLKAGTYYISKTNKNAFVQLTTVDYSGSIIGRYQLHSDSLTNQITIGAGEIAGEVFIRARGAVNDAVNFDCGLQMEIGSTASDYEPYSGTTVSISFGQTVYGGKLTVFEDGSGQAVANMAAVDMGDLTWKKSSSGVDRFYAASNASELPYKFSYNTIMLCSCYDFDGEGDAGARGYYGANGTIRYYYALNQTNTRELYVVDEAKSSMTAADFKTAVTGQTVCYELATPITIPLTPGQINTLVGENVVWVNDSDYIQVTAYGSPIS